MYAPSPGDTVQVNYEPKNHKTEIIIEGDPRYDPKLVRAHNKQEKAAREQALLSGAAPPAPGAVVYDDEPRWKVPAICPECGARVDQSKASIAEHPMCEFCEKPLPCEPIAEDY